MFGGTHDVEEYIPVDESFQEYDERMLRRAATEYINYKKYIDLLQEISE
jgi:hypothetical protein